MPKRIQRKRTKGWRMPENAVYVGRPTKWGNPYKATKECSAADAVNAYAIHLVAVLSPASLAALLEPLRGKDLACWCPLDQPCHADVLLRLANQPEG